MLLFTLGLALGLVTLYCVALYFVVNKIRKSFDRKVIIRYCRVMTELLNYMLGLTVGATLFILILATPYANEVTQGVLSQARLESILVMVLMAAVVSFEYIIVKMIIRSKQIRLKFIAKREKFIADMRKADYDRARVLAISKQRRVL